MIAARLSDWRTPAVILICGCLIGLITFGPRSTFGVFLGPMSAANGWGRDVFALALAIEMLLWGAGQPFAGALADRLPVRRILVAAALLATLALGSLAAFPSIELTLAGNTRVLTPGEAYYFSSHLPHRFRNVGREPCEIISASTPATF